MKKILIFTILLFLLIGCAFASSAIKINDAEFQLPSKYRGGEVDGDSYKLNNTFSIRCIDDDTAKAIGLWASEKEYGNDLNIANHPVRHFYQYNKYVGGYHSHAYFASGNSCYEISWVGKEIDKDIEKLIKNTPESEINSDAFYNALNESVDIYKEQKINQLNHDGEYNHLEAKQQTLLHEQQKNSDTRFNQILLTYYRR